MSSVFGSDVGDGGFFAGGGGGGTYDDNGPIYQAPGGKGGGGDGASGSEGNHVRCSNMDGMAGTGGGGGGPSEAPSLAYCSANAGSGGSGIVIIRYVTQAPGSWSLHVNGADDPVGAGAQLSCPSLDAEACAPQASSGTAADDDARPG